MTYLLKNDDSRTGRLGLLGLLAIVGLIAGALYRLGGPPHLPHQLPSQGQLLVTLEGSSVPLAAFAYVFGTATWLLLGWIVASIVLHSTVVIGERLGAPSRWIGWLRAASSRFTLPWVRRMVEAALVTTLVLNTAGRTIPAFAAPQSAPVAAVAPAAPPAVQPAEPSTPTADSNVVEYTVQKDENLWVISQRFYGDGTQYPRLVAANAGRLMPDGGRFTQAGQIYAGWKLTVPLPSSTVEPLAGGGLQYVVQPDDTLSGISARLLGDPGRFEQIFQLNAGKATDPYGHVLTQPHDIWPGMRLTIIAPQTPPTPPPAPTLVVQQPPAPVEPASPSPTVEPIVSPTVATEPAPAAPAVRAATKQAGPPAVAYGAASMAAAAVAAAGFIARRRRVRRSLAEPPVPGEPPPPMADGFAEAEPARSFAYRLQGGESEPAILLARHVEELLLSAGLTGAEIVTVASSRSKAELTLAAGAQLREQLLAFGPEVEDSLGCAAGLSVSLDHDVLLELSRLKSATVVSQLEADRNLGSSWLIPIGVRPGQQDALYGNWRQLGNLLVAGLPGGGAHTILNSLLASLIARCRPDDLQLITLTGERTINAALLGLPHQRRVVDMSDSELMSKALADVQLELNRRLDGRRPETGYPGHLWPRLVVTVGELADLGDDWAKLDDAAGQGPAVGIHVLAATLRTEELTEDVIASFGSRLVLQTMDEDESIRLLGQTDAADLTGGGDFLLRVDGRRSVRARGFRIAEDHLQELADAVAEAFGDGPRPPDEAMESEAERTLETGPAERTNGANDELASELLPFDDGRTETATPHPGVDEGIEHAVVDAVQPPPTWERPRDERTVTGAPTEPTDDGTDERLFEDVRLDFDPDEFGELDRELGEIGDDDDRVLAALAREQAFRDMAEEVDAPAPPTPSPGAGTVLEVRCLGPYDIVCGGRQLSFSSKDGPHYMPWELLAYLAVQPRGRAPCDKVCESLWPGVNPKLSRKRLHTTMWRLRTILAEQVPGLPSEVVRLDLSDTCQLSGKLVQSDIWRFDELRHTAEKEPAQKKAAYAELVGLYRGELFSDCGYDWIHSRYDSGLTLREQCRERYLDAARLLAEIYRRDGDIAGAAALYKRVLAIEPTLEDIVRELFACYALLGDKSALTREHRHLVEALRDQLRDPDDPNDDPNVYQPEPETTEAYERALASLTHRATTASPLAGA